MTDQQPDAGDPTESTETSSAAPEPQAAETGATDAEPESTSDGPETAPDDGAEGETDTAADSADDADAAGVGDPAAEVAPAAAAGAAWTTTPVAPDPEATEAALAALAAKPEVTLEPPEGPPPPPPLDGEPPDEGTPILLVGGILVGAFIVALAIVLILFRPFDSISPDPTLSPSPIVTEAPSASPSIIPAVDTPNFQGLSLEEAESTAEDYGLVVRANPVETDDVAPNTILDQDPAPGEAVEPGSTIDLAFAVPVPVVAVPDIVDLPEADALTALSDLDLVPGDRSEANDETIVSGNVISSDPAAASEVAPGSEVAYVVSVGPEVVAVPDIVDLPEADALTALSDLDLVPGDRSEANDETIVSGNVISSDPAAASEVAPGSEVAYVVSVGPEVVAVPDIVDLPEADALTALSDLDLVPGDRSEANDETIVSGNVISSDPAAASEVAPGSEVAYVVSVGPEVVAVPDIVDLPEADALTALSDLDLVPGDRSEANDETIVSGNVISSDPAAASEVAPGSEVAYVVSVGPEVVAVPDIVDLPEADALTALSDLDLVPGDRSEANDETIVSGNVISSDPAAASEVAPGSEVAYVVSVGPEVVAVPDIVDLPEADALTALSDLDLVPGDRSEANDETIVSGNVISSDPAAASEVAPGSEVAYVVSVGPEVVAVPDIVDLPEADALTALSDLDLVPGDRSEANDETIVSGNVISSDPAAASEVAPGSEVAYVVSVGPVPVRTPDFVGLSIEEAQVEAESAGVALITNPVENSDVDPGTVLDQDPSAGTTVPPGSDITLTIAVPPAQVEVPDLSGSAADAEATLASAALAGSAAEAFSDSVAAGDVVSQDPAAGTSVDIGSTVSYLISKGVEQVEVPDLSGSAADAEATLASAALAGSAAEAFSDSVAAGDVVSQDPAAGTSVDIGSTVSYLISKGVEQVEVPDLSGSAADAEATLASAALAGSAAEAFSDSVAAGDVVSQDPAAGTSVDIGSTVSYLISKGVEQVEVPDLSGSAADAEATLASAALAGSAAEAFSDSVAAGDVVSQDPAAGTSVDIGSTVSYLISKGVEQVEVPDLSGSAADAEATLASAALAGSAAEAFSDSVAAGDVVSQDPAAGTSVDIGSTVSYLISKGVEQVEVPDLSGSAADAEATLASAALAGSAAEAFSDSVAAGDVVSQDPAAGTSVDIGSTVSYLISKGVEQVEVPDLSGSAADAEATLASAALAGSAAEAFSDSVAAGDVVSQDPAAGTSVDIGSTVSYLISKGVEQVEVPDLSGSAADAEATLASAALAGSAAEAFSDSVAAGDVVSQDPAAGTSVDIGSTVSYLISKGVEQVEVPDLSGSAADAEATLASAALAGSAAEAFSDSVAAGDVVSQDPAAGTSVDIGSTVSYLISKGVEQVEVPDLSGSAADAEATLASAALAGSAAEAFSDSVAAGDVVSQDPAAGTSVDIGSTVSYLISKGVEQVEVPDLSGSAADAEATLASAALAGSAAEAFSDSVAAGDVVSQDPAAGTSVDIGSTVSYLISKGVEQVEVPDLSGSAADAEATLASAALAGSAAEAFSDSVAAGDVVSQDPAAGTSVDIGSTVSYLISKGVEQVEVPDLSGSAADAEATLASAALAGSAAEAFSDSVAAGDVVSQDPAAGTSVDIGSTVSYLIGLGPTPNVIVPDVRDLPEADAVAAIAAVDLVVAETVEQTHEKVAAGNAIKTDPAADSEILLGSSVTLYVSTGSATRTVPTVQNAPATEAQAAIEAEGLVVETQERTNAKVDAGNAVKTEPAEGSDVEVGSTVVLTVSTGPKQVLVPDIFGFTRADAAAAITAAELAVGEVTSVDDSAPKNTVLSQDPAPAAEVDKGSSVDYTVSSGPAAVTVPDVKDSPAADAQAALEAAGLVVSTEERTNANTAAGNAIKTDPAAGTEVGAGSDVLLLVSKGPKPATVPDIVGSLKAAAKTAITDAGLSVGDESSVEDASPRNTVLSQDPVADSEAAPGSSVDYTVSSGPAAVTVPDVKDSPAADAQAALEAAGLVVSTEERTNANTAAGNAIKTDPAAGTEVGAGSDVLLLVSKGPKPATVPDIVGSLKAAAKTAITDAGLSVGDESSVEDASPRNTVLSQDPVADSEAAPGSSVDYTVSSGPAAVTVPDVKDSPAADAQAALEAAGLVVSTEERTNANTAAGNAIKTDPAAGTEVGAGSDVLLLVSKGPKPATVPDIVGSLKAAAKTAITDAGLSVGDESSVEDASPRNTVLSQDPVADSEAAPGSSVDYTVSSGPAAVTVPDVKDSPAADAQAALEAAGLVVSTEERTNANTAAGNAIKTDPAAGTEVGAGSDVLLLVSKGPKPATVPDIVGSLKAAAKTAITDAGLSVGDESSVEDASPRNTVLSQDPVADSEAAPGSSVDYTVSSGPAAVTVPDVKDSPAADAQAALEAAGLVVSTEERTNANTAAGNAIKTDPAAGTEVGAGSDVLLLVSKGPKPATVPDIVGLAEPDAIAALEAANLDPGVRTEVIDETAPAGQIIDVDPDAGAVVDQGTDVDYVVSSGPPIQPRGEGGSLDNATVSAQLDEVAATVPDIRELELGNTPYDGANRANQESLLADRASILHDPATLAQEEDALRRMGLLGSGDDLAALLDDLYGQNLPMAYVEQRGRQSILQSIEKFNVAQRAEAAREFGRAATFQAFGSDATRVGDPTQGDEAIAALALEQGDGTLVMLDWAAANVGANNQSKVDDVIVPGNDGIFASMPQLLQREYSFPFLEGRLFADKLEDSGWDSVNAAWSRLPESTEQVMHPNKYGSDRPTSIGMDGVAGALGGGWSERWQQTMGELRTGVWLADGQPGTQQGPRAAVKLPKANAAAGWGGDRLVSLDGPDGSWAIVWQTKWDTPEDIGQFTKAADATIADLPGAHAVLEADASSGVSNPALVLLTSDADTLAQVAEALGVSAALGAN